MPIVSLVCGCLAFVFLIGGFVTTGVPIVGSVLSFGAPILGLAGIVTGGISMSRAKRMGESEGVAIAGMVVSVIGFVLGLLVALTCGLCNACATATLGDAVSRVRQGSTGSIPFPSLPQLPMPSPSAPLPQRPMPTSATEAAGAILHAGPVAQLNEPGEAIESMNGWRYSFQSIACPSNVQEPCVVSFTVTRHGVPEPNWTELPRYALEPEPDGYLGMLTEAVEQAVTEWEAAADPSVAETLGIRIPAVPIPPNAQAALVDELNSLCSLTCSRSDQSQYSYLFTSFECPADPQGACTVAFTAAPRGQRGRPAAGSVEIPRYATRYYLSSDDPGYGEVSEALYGELDAALLRRQAAR